VSILLSCKGLRNNNKLYRTIRKTTSANSARKILYLTSSMMELKHAPSVVTTSLPKYTSKKSTRRPFRVVVVER